MDDWKQQAEALYFNEHLRIGEVAGAVGKSRQSVSAFLKKSDQFEAEQIYRREQAGKKRKKEQLAWDRNNRSPFVGTDAVYEGVKRQHQTDVRVLSSEKYFRD